MKHSAVTESNCLLPEAVTHTEALSDVPIVLSARDNKDIEVDVKNTKDDSLGLMKKQSGDHTKTSGADRVKKERNREGVCRASDKLVSTKPSDVNVEDECDDVNHPSVRKARRRLSGDLSQSEVLSDVPIFLSKSDDDSLANLEKTEDESAEDKLDRIVPVKTEKHRVKKPKKTVTEGEDIGVRRKVASPSKSKKVIAESSITLSNKLSPVPPEIKSFVNKLSKVPDGHDESKVTHSLQVDDGKAYHERKKSPIISVKPKHQRMPSRIDNEGVSGSDRNVKVEGDPATKSKSAKAIRDTIRSGSPSKSSRTKLSKEDDSIENRNVKDAVLSHGIVSDNHKGVSHYSTRPSSLKLSSSVEDRDLSVGRDHQNDKAVARSRTSSPSKAKIIKERGREKPSQLREGEARIGEASTKKKSSSRRSEGGA